MSPAHNASRRRAIRTLFFSSAAMSLNVRTARASPTMGKNGLHLLAIGDFGTGSTEQKAVSKAMQDFVAGNSITPDALLMLGDNFYGAIEGGFTVESDRWRTGIEEMYPVTSFPSPMYPVLGNHDYHDNEGSEKTQLAYAKKPGVRWTLPAKWHRVDMGGAQPSLTLICLDSNLPSISGQGKSKATGLPLASLTADEESAQLEWLAEELGKPRAPFTLVLGHHPIYSNGEHGDNKRLTGTWETLFQKHKVHAYLCGHDHDLQHLELEGRFTSHVLSGGGGARIRNLKSQSRKMPYGSAVYGFTHLHALPDALTITHYGADASVLHRFTKRTTGEVEIA